jgi:hypothetical protein
MNSYDRMKALCLHHGISRNEKFGGSGPHFIGENSVLGYYPTHD